MAYVSVEMTKAVRESLKKEFKGFKFGVRKNAHCSTLYITILKSPVDLSGDVKEGWEYADLNPYHLDSYKNKNLYKKIIETMKKATACAGSAYYDESDSQTDYFNCAYYYSLSIGDYNKPCVFGE